MLNEKQSSTRFFLIALVGVVCSAFVAVPLDAQINDRTALAELPRLAEGGAV